jgi:short subunit dehydrogenase-like uncharacterized protein
MVAVYGATGYAGRLVVAELVQRGITPIAIARNSKDLAAASFSGAEVLRRRQAFIEDARSLEWAIDAADAVINCAGPFVDTAFAVASAAIRTGIHYLDLCAEQSVTRQLMAKMATPARKAGIAVLPSVAFFGGLADLLISVALEDWEAADLIEIHIALDNWSPTDAMVASLRHPRMFQHSAGPMDAEDVAADTNSRFWDFQYPFGRRKIMEVPVSATALITRHIQVDAIRSYLSYGSLDTQVAKTPEGWPDSSPTQNFAIEVAMFRGSERRRAVALGDNIYTLSAALICATVRDLLEGRLIHPGVHAPSEIFNARELLRALQPGHISIQVVSNQIVGATRLSRVH